MYGVREDGLVLVKNVNNREEIDNRLNKVSKIVFYDENPIKMALLDNY